MFSLTRYPIIFLLFLIPSTLFCQNLDQLGLMSQLFDSASSMDLNKSKKAPAYQPTDYLQQLKLQKEIEFYEQSFTQTTLSKIELYFNYRRHSFLYDVSFNVTQKIKVDSALGPNNLLDLDPSLSAQDPLALLTNITLQEKLAKKFQSANDGAKSARKIQPSVDHQDVKIAKNNIVKQFGYSFFNLKFGNTLDQPVNDSYQLGPGDQLNLKIWGKLNESLDIEIDSSGYVYLPKSGQVRLSGLSLKKANRIVRSLLRKHFVNLDSFLSLTNQRTIIVYRVGHFKQTGPLSISAGTSLIDILNLSGGPLKTGSLRKLALKRNGRIIQTIDLYDFLINGKSYSKINLKQGDTIYIPPVQSTVMVHQAVNRPGIYEFKKPISAYDLIYTFSGGLISPLTHQAIRIDRLDPIAQKSSTIYIYDDNSAKFLKSLKSTFIHNSDIISVIPIAHNYTHSIKVYGAVSTPGMMPFKEGLTVSELFSDIIFSPDANQSFIHLYRINESKTKRKLLFIPQTAFDSTRLHPLDVIKVFRLDETNTSKQYYIHGAIQKSGHQVLYDRLKLSDAILMSEPNPDALLNHFEVVRLYPEPKRFQASSDIFSNPGSDENIFLQSGDQIHVKSDIRHTEFEFVSIKGQVPYPGKYAILPNTTLYDALIYAGGLKENAFIKGLILKRISQRDSEIQSQQQGLFEEQKQLFMTYSEKIDIDRTKLSKALTFLRTQGNKSNGRIIVQLPQTLAELKDSIYNITLDADDTIFIPKEPHTVQILGGVQKPTSLVFVGKKSLKYYLSQAGGFSQFADKRRIYIFKPNGTVQNVRSSIRRHHIEEGDTIYVSESIKINKNWMDVISQTTQILYNLVTSASLANLFK